MSNKPRRKGQAAPKPAPSRAQAQSDGKWKTWAIWGGGLLAVGLLVAVVLGGVGSVEGRAEPPPGVARLVAEIEAPTHTQDPVVYPHNPPAGGPHHPQWLNCGVYDTPVPNENAVHALEHGAVWITYQPGLSDEDIDRLEDLVKSEVILSPYPGLDSAVAASAWGNQLKVDSADDERLKQFVSAFRNGPDAPEVAAGCTGGVGNPA